MAQGRGTLQGSRIYKDNIATANDALIDVLEDNGAIVIGKTNTPEFGAGANTFNEYARLHGASCIGHALNQSLMLIHPGRPNTAFSADYAIQT